MSPNDTRPLDGVAKHWILGLAVDHPVWLKLLFPSVKAESLNVRPIPGFTADDYAECLKDLLDAGMIRVSDADTGDGTDVDEALGHLLGACASSPTTSKEGEPCGSRVSFGLTVSGGEMWERLANPDWSRLLVESSDLVSAELMAPDRDVLMAHMGWYPEIGEYSVVWESVELIVRTDFPVLYWKRLPSVHCASFKVQPAKPRWGFPAPLWFREWRTAARSWHKHAWDVPNWPLSA